MNIAIPAVVRLGGNSEDRAVEILEDACSDLPAPVRGLRKDDTPAECAVLFHNLVQQCGGQPAVMQRRVPEYVGNPASYSFPITGGRVWIDHAACDAATTQLVIQYGADLLCEQGGKPVLAVSQEETAGKDSELIACEIECRRAGSNGVGTEIRRGLVGFRGIRSRDDRVPRLFGLSALFGEGEWTVLSRLGAEEQRL